MPSAKALRENRAKLAKQIRELAEKANNENRDFSAEEKGNWEKVNADYDAASRQIEVAERAESVDQDQRDPAGDRRIGRDDRNPRDSRGGKKGTKRERRAEATEEDRAVALQAWCRHQTGKPLRREHKAACQRTGMNPGSRRLDIKILRTHQVRDLAEAMRSVHPSNANARALSAVAGPTGGYSIAPLGFVTALELAMLQFGGMRQDAEIIRTDTGAELPWPTANDTTNTGELIGENISVANEADPAIGQVRFGAYKYSSKLVKVPVELLEDSAFDLASLLGGMLGERLGRKENTHFTTGDGANKPYGLLARTTLGVTAASAAAITADEILGLEHSVDPAYRVGASWQLADSTLLVLRKLKDGNGVYLWQAGLQSNAPDRLSGYPVRVNQDIPAIAASAKVMTFGQHKKYKIRDVGSVRMRRLVERFADTDQEGFIAFQRCDGNLLDAGVAPVKHLVMAP